MSARRWSVVLASAASFACLVPASAMAYVGCTIPLGMTTCTVEQSSPGIVVTRARPIINVKVTNLDYRTASDKSDCASLTYQLFLRGSLVYEASLLPGQDNYDGPGTSTGGDNVGTFKPGNYPYREIVEFRVGPGCPPRLPQYTGTAQSALVTLGRGARGYHLNVSAVDLLATGQGERRYFGNDWNPRGKPIEIFFGAKKIRTFRATASFRGTFPTGFPDSSCVVTLRAKQGRVTRTIRGPAGRRSETVELVDGPVRVQGGRTLRRSDTVCGGEIVSVGARGAFVGKAIRSTVAGYAGMRVISRQTGIDVPGGIFAKTVLISLSGGRTARLSGTAADPRPYDPELNTHNYHTFPPGREPSLNLTGLARSPGDLTVVGAAELDNALLYVQGSLAVLGGVHAVGAVLVAQQDLRLAGPIRAQSDVADGAALVAGRTMSLVGTGR